MSHRAIFIGCGGRAQKECVYTGDPGKENRININTRVLWARVRLSLRRQPYTIGRNRYCYGRRPLWPAGTVDSPPPGRRADWRVTQRVFSACQKHPGPAPRVRNEPERAQFEYVPVPSRKQKARVTVSVSSPRGRHRNAGIDHKSSFRIPPDSRPTRASGP